MESLSHTYSIKALLILLREGRRMRVEEIAAAMEEQRGAVVHAIDALSDGGLVEAREEFGAPYKEDVSLTEKGRFAAEKLREIEARVGWVGRGGNP